ncbi:MAG: putative outer membrane repeat protein [Myxococcota bacterium]|jgi:predicted outer membrane repeat protein
MILLTGIAAAATLTVGEDADTLQAALDEAGPTDTIALPAGDWPGCVTSGGTVTIEGAGPSRTTIRGGDCAENFVQTGGELSLTGLTLSNPGGRALKVTAAIVSLTDIHITDSGTPRLAGGGMHLGDSDSTLTEVRFSNNTAARGGGLHVEGGSLTAVGIEMTHNTAQFGGGLSARKRARIHLSICRFSDNIAAEKGYGKGGAIYGFGGVTLEDSGSSFTNNAAAVYGGAILLERDGGALTLTGTTLTGNHIQDDAPSESSGGAVFADAIGTVTFTEARFEGNKAYLYGGAAYLGRLQQGATITDSVFTNNAVVSKRGGALEVMEGGELRVSGGTFSGNTAPEGGGAISLFNNSARLSDEVVITNNHNTSTQDAFGGGVFAFSNQEHTLTLDHVTITGNRAAMSGGGVYASGLAALRVVESDISGNTASTLDVSDRYFGGGINAHDIPTVAISGSRFCGNTADDGASLYLIEVASTSVMRSSLDGVPGERGSSAEAKAAGVSGDGEVVWSGNQACF